MQGFNYFVAGGKPNNVLEFRRLGKKKESKIHIHMNMHNNINTNKSNKSNKTHPYKQQRLKASNICWKCTFIWKLAGEGHVEHALRCFAFRSIRIRVVGMVHVSINAIQLSTTSTEGTNGSPPVCGRWSTPSVSSNYPPKKQTCLRTVSICGIAPPAKLEALRRCSFVSVGDCCVRYRVQIPRPFCLHSPVRAIGTYVRQHTFGK